MVTAIRSIAANVVQRRALNLENTPFIFIDLAAKRKVPGYIPYMKGNHVLTHVNA